MVVLNHNLDNLIVYASTNGSAVRSLPCWQSRHMYTGC